MKKPNNDRLIVLVILLVGTSLLWVSSVAPRPLADSITKQFEDKRVVIQIENIEKEP